MDKIKPYPKNKEVEDIDEEMNKEDSREKKREAAKDILKFVIEMVDHENINVDLEEDNPEAIEVLMQPKKILENLRSINFDQFKSIIDNINARANRVPVSKEQRSDIEMTFGGHETQNIFPTPEKNEEIWEDTFEKVKEKLNSDDNISDDDAETVALTLFNMVGDTHVYKDGNGRTLRAIYYLLSPRINKNQESFISDFTDVVSKQNGKGITGEVDALFQRTGYMSMLLDRGLNPTYKDNGAFYCENKQLGYSFEDNRMKYLALYDSLKNSDEFDFDEFMTEPEEYEVKEGFVEYALPFAKDSKKNELDKLKNYSVTNEKWAEVLKNKELFKKIKVKVKDVREEYVRRVIDMSLNENLRNLDEDKEDFGDHIYNKLDKAFN